MWVYLGWLVRAQKQLSKISMDRKVPENIQDEAARIVLDLHKLEQKIRRIK